MSQKGQSKNNRSNRQFSWGKKAEKIIKVTSKGTCELTSKSTAPAQTSTQPVQIPEKRFISTEGWQQITDKRQL